MELAVLRRPRTQAILDGKIKAGSLPIAWAAIDNPLGWARSSTDKDQSILSGRFVGGEMSISAFIQAKAQGAPLSALPIFLKRGLVQRNLICSVKSALTAPAELIGKRVGLVGYTSSMACWMRGVLENEYGLPRAGVQWFSATPSSHARLLEIPADFAPAKIEAREESDGYAHPLERRESFLLSRIITGELDSVISFQTTIASNDIRPLLTDDDHIWAHYRRTTVYPINHIFVVHEELFSRLPGASQALLSAFRDARRLWKKYLPEQQQSGIEEEIGRLGWDPFAYQLGDVEKKTLETFIGFLFEEKLISRKPSLRELFHEDVVQLGI